ncbi:CC0125/CC1285 family lipoprotein [Parvularcula sp. LCG005]|uniref:CC0125/CC1285 family lipoprotein n=1 Tax=Parvularcula sp. LCG005 TaxID=3078805 RepID=UPI0029424F17|nr:hypothetical protein [Parvularcula sp. LCG005]WOI53076.1 hypothetical protein RUI03_13065 [Parvularcula sp. LCG005]
MRRFISLALLALMAACSTYGPSAGGNGYTDTKITDTRYLIEGRAMSFETARNIAMVRAAELTEQNGFDHFVVLGVELDDRDLSESELAEYALLSPGVWTGGMRNWGDESRARNLPVIRVAIMFATPEQAAEYDGFAVRSVYADYGDKIGYRG